MTGELTPFYAWGETGSGDGIFVFIAILPFVLIAIILLVLYAVLWRIRNKPPEETDDSTKESDSSENDDTNENK